MERGFFPLDEELGLGSLALSPRLAEGLVRLGTHLPFGVAVDTLAFFTGVQLTDETARTVTEAAGAALGRIEASELQRAQAPDAPPPIGPEEQVLSLDGAMVPLVGGEWAEVKTLVIGRLDRTSLPSGGYETHARELSYCSRLVDAESFGALAEGELYRRGTDGAKLVCAPTDGAEWIARFLSFHCPSAIPILDFPHAVEHPAAAAHATFGPGTAEGTAWLEAQRKELREGGAATVLAALRALPVERAVDPTGADQTRGEVLAYLTKREANIAYSAFIQAGYPIGSGIVESANKLVVEERLKGSGMHWTRANVNSMVALRAAACSGRWAERWPQIWAELRRMRAAACQARRASPQRPPAPEVAEPPPPAPAPPPRVSPKPLPSKGTFINGKPTKEHPWKQRPLLHSRKSDPVRA